MGLRGPGAYPWSARFPPARKVHVTHTLTCWTCRKRFTAKRIDATYCFERLQKPNLPTAKSEQAGLNGTYSS